MTERPDPAEVGARIAEYLRCLHCGLPGAVAVVGVPRSMDDNLLVVASYCGRCWHACTEDKAA